MNRTLAGRALRLTLIAGIFVLGVLAQASGLVEDLLSRWDDIAYLSQEHMVLVAISGGLAILVGVPLGLVLSRPSLHKAAEPALQALNVGTTVPTLAVLALSMSFLGIGATPAIFALWVTTLLPIVRNTLTGIISVPQPLIEAATGMGMTPMQVLLKVEIPNALYVIFAGIRTALTINVGTAPLAFLIGAGGLGEMIFTGINLNEPGMMLAGAISTAVLAVLTDVAIGTASHVAVPRGIRPAG